jgi:hypothetical protein
MAVSGVPSSISLTPLPLIRHFVIIRDEFTEIGAAVQEVLLLIVRSFLRRGDGIACTFDVLDVPKTG